MYAFLIERVRANLHIVLGMSPVGEPFRYISLSLLLAANLFVILYFESQVNVIINVKLYKGI